MGGKETMSRRTVFGRSLLVRTHAGVDPAWLKWRSTLSAELSDAPRETTRKGGSSNVPGKQTSARNEANL